MTTVRDRGRTMDILLLAYINKNYGDDLFIDMVCRRYPQHTFHVLSSENMTDFLSQIPNLRVHIYNKVIRAVNARIASWLGRNYLMERLAKRYRYCICIGGSIFIQSDNWRKIAKERESLRKRTTKYFVISANFGPYYNSEYFRHYEDWFAKLSDVCFRERYSSQLFSQIRSVRYAPDAIFGYLTKECEQISDSQKTMIVSCIDYSWREKDKCYLYEHCLARIITQYLDMDWNVVLMALCKQEGDNCAIERIHEMVSGEKLYNLRKYSYDGDYKETCALLKTADFVISSRFHATIIPLTAGVPVLPIPYSDKTRNMLHDIGYDGPIWELSNGSISQEELARAQNYHFDIHNVVKMAQDQFKSVDWLLCSE